MVTVKEQALVLPELSVAVQLTVEAPVGKVEPDGGVQELVTPGQLSVATAFQVTLLLVHWPASAAPTILGQVMVGASLSLMVTVKEQVALLLEVSVAVQVTVVDPFGKVECKAGVQERVTPGQLSVALKPVHVTLVFSHEPGSVVPTTSAGQVMVGFSVSLIVTVKEQVLMLPEASVAGQLTVETPVGKVEPEGGAQELVTPGQLSEEETAQVTLLFEHWPLSATPVMLAGQVMEGACASLTVTVKVQALVLPAASVAVQVTVFVPTAKAVPLTGAQATVTPGQLSVAEGVA